MSGHLFNMNCVHSYVIARHWNTPIYSPYTRTPCPLRECLNDYYIFIHYKYVVPMVTCVPPPPPRKCIIIHRTLVIHITRTLNIMIST